MNSHFVGGGAELGPFDNTRKLRICLLVTRQFRCVESPLLQPCYLFALSSLTSESTVGDRTVNNVRITRRVARIPFRWTFSPLLIFSRLLRVVFHGLHHENS